MPASSQRGSALLAVLWLSAALAAIAFSLATTVRGETERTSTELDGLRSYYLATGGIARASAELLWSAENPGQRVLPKGSTRVDYRLPSGDVRVEIIPETAKLDVNHAPVAELFRLALALGVEPGRAQTIAEGIADWRAAGGGPSAFDGYYLSLTPSFRSRHASFEEIEELLLVRGVTPDIFYGTWLPAPEGAIAAGGPRLVPRSGLADCLTVYGSGERVDGNTANPAVLAAIGLSPYAISALVERRQMAPLTLDQLYNLLGSVGADPSRLRVEGNSIVTMRATARLRLANGQLSDLRRTVAAQIKYLARGYGYSQIHILRWYDTAWSF
ncbi:MAG: general secretion pathway protein GspK [Acidobacteriia bacterium]|nr:general secretion pathway protein GspK [Terriglobia bacterium]